MEHHLGFLADSAYREAATVAACVGGTFTGIISLPEVGKSSIFVSSWLSESPKRIVKGSG
jgi:hypothetical protein